MPSPGLDSPVQETHGHTGGSSVEGHPEVGTLEHVMHEETLRIVGFFSLEKRVQGRFYFSLPQTEWEV